MKLFGFLQGQGSDKLLGGRYRLIDLLGEGGFGQTFLAEDLHLPGNARCVVKQLKPQVSDPENLKIAGRLFDTEAKVLGRLGTHDQIPRLMAHFQDGEEFYLVQELIDGQPLNKELVAGKPWSEQEVFQLLQDILEVLAFVHSQNVIHRDIKPPNLMRRSDGKIVLIDFGAVKEASARLSHPDSGSTQTISIGTQGYMPNEQLAGHPRFSSDVYAVGMIGIQALTGCAPKKLGQDPQTGEVLWRDRAPDVSSTFAYVLDHMVRYDFRSRYSTATEALNALQQIESNWDTNATQVPQKRKSKKKLNQPANPPSVLQKSTQTLNSTGLLENAANAPPMSRKSAASLGTVPAPFTRSQTLQVVLSTLTTLVSRPRRLLATATGVTALIGLVVWLQLDKPPQPIQSAATSGRSTASPSSQPDQATQVKQLLEQANQQRQAKQYKSSLSLYQQALKLDAKSAEAHWGKCYNLNYLKQPGAAITACNAALNVKPKYPEALWSKGYALDQQGDHTEALKLYDRAIALKPNFAEAWNNKGVSLLFLRRPEEALTAFNKATGLKPDLAAAWNNRGAALWSLRRYDEAIVSIDRSIKIQPDYKDALSLRRQIRERLGR